MNRNYSEEEIVCLDRDSLYIGNLNTVEFDLQLPERGDYGSEICWRSEHEVFLGNDGRVKRPAYGTGDRIILLHAGFRYGKATAEKTFEVHILEEENHLKVAEVWPVRICILAGEEVHLPQAAIVDTADGDRISHPVVWKDGATVKYEVCGSYKREGVLTGTNISVEAVITVKDQALPEMKDREKSVRECEEADIRLLPGSPFYEAQERMKNYLLSVDDDQMLYNFRTAAGLETGNAEPMEGWDSPSCKLKGHTTGHYMSALALCFRATGDRKIREKAVYMTEVMGQCQDAFAKMPGIHEGFLSGYSEEQFDLLEEYTPYPKIWAPYYTLHKLLAGLLDCYRYVGLEKALHICEKLGMWVWKRLSALDYDKRVKMWSMYIAGEFGGMNDVMAQLYDITGKEEFLACAKLFDNDKLFYPLEQREDALSTMHANQHIPQVLGAMRIFEVTGEKRYYDIAEFFRKAVKEGHMYAPGGCGESEMFHRKGEIGSLLTKNTQETCASYNMLKLTKELYQYDPKSSYMDDYENTVYNHILATQEKKETGESTYFFPLEPGSKREFLRENNCCHGTGMESHFKYREGIYYEDGGCVYINLFIPSSLEWKEKDIFIRMEQSSVRLERIRLHVKGTGIHTLKIRYPKWADQSVITENGQQKNAAQTEDGYITVSRDFSEGTEIEVTFPFRFRILRAPDVPERAAVGYGPYIMAALSEEKEFYTFPFSESDIEDKMIPEADGHTFVCEGVRWLPLYMVDNESYHVYGICPQ